MCRAKYVFYLVGSPDILITLPRLFLSPTRVLTTIVSFYHEQLDKKNTSQGSLDKSGQLTDDVNKLQRIIRSAKMSRMTIFALCKPYLELCAARITAEVSCAKGMLYCLGVCNKLHLAQ